MEVWTHFKMVNDRSFQYKCFLRVSWLQNYDLVHSRALSLSIPTLSAHSQSTATQQSPITAIPSAVQIQWQSSQGFRNRSSFSALSTDPYITFQRKFLPVYVLCDSETVSVWTEIVAKETMQRKKICSWILWGTGLLTELDCHWICIAEQMYGWEMLVGEGVGDIRIGVIVLWIMSVTALVSLQSEEPWTSTSSSLNTWWPK